MTEPMTENDAPQSVEADETCPLCKANLRDAPKIGHVVRGVYDGVLFWSCPHCVQAWPRFVWRASRAYAATFNAEHNSPSVNAEHNSPSEGES